MKNNPTPASIINQIRVNENIAAMANDLSERLERFSYVSPEYVSEEEDQKVLDMIRFFDDIQDIERRANERLYKEYKQLNKRTNETK